MRRVRAELPKLVSGAIGFLCLVCMMSFSARSYANENEAFWFKADFPPYIIVSGPNNGAGIDDKIADYMIKRLPEYSFSFMYGTYKRVTEQMKALVHGVITPIFKTPERNKYMLFSDVASYLVLPNGLIIKKSEKKKFEPFMLPDGTLDIEALCASGRFVIGFSSGRSYSGILDDIIRKYKDSSILYERTAINQAGIMKMLEAKRVHAVFGFPVEIKFAGLENELESLHVAKMVPYIPVYFGVPKDEWGQKIIKKLNAIVHDGKVLAEFSGYYEQWLSDEDRQYHKKLTKEYYDNLAKSTQ